MPDQYSYSSARFAELVPMTRQQLVEKLRGQLSDYRFNHCLRVEQTAMALAAENGVDITQAGIAGLLHDYAKEKSDAEFKAMIAKHQLDTELLAYGNNIWHGEVGQYFIAEELGVTDPEILSAIAHHTSGAAQMSTLDKIIFVADYVEPGRDYPGAAAARASVAAGLDAAVAYELDHTLIHLIDKQQRVYPAMFAAYNQYGLKQEEH
ncbi:bis(5'-nucleosyl)-tetraphosphatase (symmetrical) YqeK [Lapidilactobacillus luobeiensis]|uniref:bis(5'-nucleosyl)-tetraphosphatase (symmetrical) YqeK n=1 Tax=Lapidilactobacillus luobeiensis TaxID=2950371 RepID=UPI0021C449C6|nr:bis(5'-nucleosyl)-tetraphosphatase (symmetrical) YqeK [Lapidilactobacillus luobeiensis]